MEEQLAQIVTQFNSGAPKEATAHLTTLLANLRLEAPDTILPTAYDALGEFRNYLGDADGACDAWADGAALLQDREAKTGETLSGNEKMILLEFCLQIGRLSIRQGREGSGVIRKKRQVCYGPTKTANEEEEKTWKEERFARAEKFLQMAIDRLGAPEDSEMMEVFQTTLAGLYEQSDKPEKAIKLYREAWVKDPEDETWPLKVALMEQKLERWEESLQTINQLLAKHPKSADGHDLLAKYHHHKGDKAAEAEVAKKVKFLNWIPSFCEHLDYTEDNVAKLALLSNGETGFEFINDTLRQDQSPASTEWLLAVCWHHYHGRLEDTAFSILAERATDKSVADKVFSMLRQTGGICTIKGCAKVLASAKDERTFDILKQLLPQDVNLFPMHIAESFGVLGDPRAIPILVSCMGLARKEAALARPEGASQATTAGKEDEDSDSDDDEIMFEIGNDRRVAESCFALRYFGSEPSARDALERALKVPSLKQIALVALFVIDNDTYLPQVEALLSPSGGLQLEVKHILSRWVKHPRIVELLHEIEEEEKREQQRKNEEYERGVEQYVPSDEELAVWRESKVINMSGKRTQTVHPAIFELHDAVELNLGGNRLRELPAELSRFTALTSLDLSSNRLAGALSDVVADLTSLTKLDLSRNKLTQLPESIGQLTELRVLSVSHNALVSVPPALSLLTNLEGLDLDYNHDLEALPETMAGLVNLKKLNVGHCKLKSEGMPDLSKLSKLERLVADANELTALPRGLDQCAALTYLSVENNSITDKPEWLSRIATCYMKQKHEDEQNED